MEKKKSFAEDGYNQLSLLVIVIGLIGYFVSVNHLSSVEDTFPDRFSIFGTVVTMAGFIITIIQLLKISSTTKVYEQTFNNAIDEYKKNEYISIISMAIQQIEIIKKLLEIEKEFECRSSLSILLICMNRLAVSEIEFSQKDRIQEFMEVVSELEVDVFSKANLAEPDNRKAKYGQLVKLHILLSGIESEIKTPKKISDGR